MNSNTLKIFAVRLGTLSLLLLSTCCLVFANWHESTLRGPANARLVEAAGPLSPDKIADALTSNAWYWKRFAPKTGAVEIDQPRAYELNFAKDGSLSIKADCNRAFGSYRLDGSNLSIEVGPSTLALCPGESRSEQFLQLLVTAQKLIISGELLIMMLKDDSAISFTAPSLVDRCGEKVLAPRSLVDTIDPKVSSQLDKKLSAFLTPGVNPAAGASMLILTPKGRYFKAVGVSDVAACTPLNADSNYQIGSNTKMMTGAIIYQLQEQRKLSTSDLIRKYLPDESSKLVNGNEITIEMLLTHTSGLTDYFDVESGDETIADGVANRSILTRGYRPQDLIKLVADSGRSDFKPGETGKWKYSNTGYILLGMIIEKVTKRSYEENLKSRIFKPLGLKKTYFQTGQPAVGALPRAYYRPPFTFPTDEWNASQGWSAGAVVSTSEEFAVFLKALFTGKLFKNRATLGLMRTSAPSGKGVLGEGTVYCHGMLENHGVLGHGGETLGFQSDGGYLPENDVTVVIWANSAVNNVNRLAVPVLAGILTGK